LSASDAYLKTYRLRPVQSPFGPLHALTVASSEPQLFGKLTRNFRSPA
jgi:hypothetical protein